MTTTNDSDDRTRYPVYLTSSWVTQQEPTHEEFPRKEPSHKELSDEELADEELFYTEPAVIDADESRSDVPTLVRVIHLVIEWVVILATALALAFLLKAFVVQTFYIPSGSMESTLGIGDRVVVYKVGYRLHDINRGDIVVFSKPNESYQINELIKRVVALGGETFELRDGNVYIDGLRLVEPYLEPGAVTLPKLPIPGCINEAMPSRCKVPKGTVLVLGDNREGSRDGRFFGPINVDTVIGRAFLRVWPIDSISEL